MFKGPLLLEGDPVPDMWILYEPLVWEDALYGRLEIPVGFRTDLASIPRLFRNLSLLDPNGLSRRPAAMHDWLYAWRQPGKDFADNFLRDSLLAEEASASAAKIFFYAVHWFGGSSWASDEGAIETRDFDTADHYKAWLNSQRILEQKDAGR